MGNPDDWGEKMKIEPNKSLVNSLIVFSLLFLSSSALAQDSTLVSFRLKDQFDRVYTDKYLRNSVVIVFGCDKDGSKYNQIWSKAIVDSLRNDEGFDQLKSLAVADLRGVPFFLKGFVKGKFPRERGKWALMDWEGEFAKAYKFEPKSCNINIIDRSGNVVHRMHGQEIDYRKLKAVLEKLRALMRDDNLEP